MPQTELSSDSEPQFYELRHGFRVGGFALLLQQYIHAELIPCGQVCSIPETPDWFVGFINHRGEAVPVYDLARSLSQKDEKTRQRWLLLLDRQPDTAALLLYSTPQGITDPQQLEQEECIAIPDELQRFCSGQYHHQDMLWLEFDHRAFFATQKAAFNKDNSTIKTTGN